MNKYFNTNAKVLTIQELIDSKEEFFYYLNSKSPKHKSFFLSWQTHFLDREIKFGNITYAKFNEKYIEKELEKIVNERTKMFEKEFANEPKIIYFNKNTIDIFDDYSKKYSQNWHTPYNQIDAFAYTIMGMEVREDNFLRDWEFRLE